MGRGRGPSVLGSGLEPVREETKFSKRQGRRIQDWDNLNVKYLKELNKKEALKKIAGYWKNKTPKRQPTSLMEQLNPSYN